MLNLINLSTAFGIAKTQEKYLSSTKKAIKTLPDRFIFPKSTPSTQWLSPYDNTLKSNKAFSIVKKKNYS